MPRLDGAGRLRFCPGMAELPSPQQTHSATALPPSIERVLARFRRLGREEKMQALVSYAKKLEPLPDRFLEMDRGAFTIPECQTRVDIFPEFHDGRMHYYVDLDTRTSPTIAAFLAIVLSAVNDEPPETTLAIPPDFVRTVMESIGLGTREIGLDAMIARLKRYARDAQASAA
ncbi:MAG TPA: SufE family protein [Gemmatimonadaceae bacterium]|nr:SufE family protein [Gemmatimonadaceae bacterium]